MPAKITSFTSRIYKPVSVIIFAVIFFAAYNAYLVDHSLVNLRIALDRVAEAKTPEEFKKIKSLLKLPILSEVSKTTVSSRALISMEMAENVLGDAKAREQLKEAKYYLQTVVEAKEKEKGGAAAFLNRVNSRIFAPKVKVEETQVAAKVKDLLGRIKATKDTGILQGYYYDLGNAYVQLNKIPEAEEAFLKIVDLDPNSALAAEAIFNIGWAYKSIGGYDKAELYFKKLEELYAKAKVTIDGKYQVADMLFKRKDYKQAADKYSQLAEEHPEFDIADLAFYEAGYISYEYLNDTEAAMKYFSKLDSKYPSAQISKHALNEIRPRMSDAYRKKGFMLLAEGKYIEALDAFNRAVDISPLDGLSTAGMGLGYYWLGKKVEALGKTEKALRLSPFDESVLVNILFVYVRSGLLDEAIITGERPLFKRITIKKAEFYYNLSVAYILKRDFNRAASNLKEAIKLNPSFLFAYNNLGYILWLRGEYQESVAMFKKAIKLNPKYANAHFNLGIAYFYLAQLEDAYKEFKAVLEIDPNYKNAAAYQKRAREALGYEP